MEIESEVRLEGVTIFKIVVASLAIWFVAIAVMVYSHDGSPERKEYDSCVQAAHVYSHEQGWTPVGGVEAWCVTTTN